MFYPPAIVLIQARLGSSRLPGKSALALPLGEASPSATILGHVVRRAQQAQLVSEIIVATTTEPLDDELVDLANHLNVGVFRGSEQNVLSRFAEAFTQRNFPEVVTAIVRLTADNPAIDPRFLDEAIRYHLGTGADYTHTTGLPLGTNLEILSPAALLRAHREANQPDEREHVTPYLRRHPELFNLETLTLTVPPAVAELRLTVDYPSDYAMLSVLFNSLGPNFALADLEALLRHYPWLAEVNAGNVQH